MSSHIVTLRLLCVQMHVQRHLVGEPISGSWPSGEIFVPFDLAFTSSYINAVELLAIKFELLSFKELLRDKHVLVKCDNTTAVAYIRNMGGTHSVVCNQIAKDIWTWCQSMYIWLSCTHISGISNSVPDEESRKQNVRTEWKLASVIFVELCNILGHVQIPIAEILLMASWPRCRTCGCFY